MEICVKNLYYPPSSDRTKIWDITPDVNSAIKQSGHEQGLAIARSNHTTLGLFVNEVAERNLLADIIRFSQQLVHEDVRGTWVSEGEPYKYQTSDEYAHACMDSPLRPPDEVDEDYNAARHLRAMLLSQPSVSLPFRQGELELGRYQQLAAFEFDGRDGTGRNPMRHRLVQVWLYPAQGIRILD